MFRRNKLKEKRIDKETEERLLKELRAENLSKNDILAIIIATFEINVIEK